MHHLQLAALQFFKILTSFMNDLISIQFFLGIKCTLFKNLYSPIYPCLSHRKYFFHHSLTSVSFQIISSILFWISFILLEIPWLFLCTLFWRVFFISIKDILHSLYLFQLTVPCSLWQFFAIVFFFPCTWYNIFL